MNEASNHIGIAKKELMELEEVQNQLSIDKTTFTASMLGIFMRNIQDGLEELSEKEFYPKELGKEICAALNKAMETFANIKIPEVKPPVVNIAAAQIHVDLKPVADSISKQGSILIKLVEKLESKDDGKTEELQKLIIAMVDKQNAFIEKGFSQINYSDHFTKLIKAVSDSKPTISKLIISKNNLNGATEIIPEYNKLSNV